jgi:hypothetical protein
MRFNVAEKARPRPRRRCYTLRKGSLFRREKTGNEAEKLELQKACSGDKPPKVTEGYRFPGRSKQGRHQLITGNISGSIRERLVPI